MVMKDKLHKNHHKGSYYVFKNFALSLILVFSFIGAIAIPTYIGLKQVNSQTKADQQEEEEKDPNNNEDPNNNSSSAGLLKYSD